MSSKFRRKYLDSFYIAKIETVVVVFAMTWFAAFNTEIILVTTFFGFCFLFTIRKFEKLEMENERLKKQLETHVRTLEERLRNIENSPEDK